MRLGLAILMLAGVTASMAASPTPPPAEADAKADAKPETKGEAKPETKAAAPVKKACYSNGETREEIKGHGLREPFAALKLAAQHYKAEALSAKLCRIDDEFVYEIALLHKDGRYFHAFVSATTGKLVDLKRLAAPPAKP